MKKRFCRYLAVALSVLLITGLLGACSGKGSKAPGGSDKGKSNGKDGKKTIHIMGPESSNTYVKFKDREKYSSWKEFEKLFKEKGITPKFEIVANDQYKTTLQTRMAAAVDLPDFLNVSNLDDATIVRMANQGLYPVWMTHRF